MIKCIYILIFAACLQALAAAQRQCFTLEWSRVKKEIADEKAGILPPPFVPKLFTPIDDRGGKKQRRSSGGKGKATGAQLWCSA